MSYGDFFAAVTQKPEGPFEYQKRFAENVWPDVLNVPTGLGKTAAVVVAWLYKRLKAVDAATPRRLVYCLPMRVLVEQTEENAHEWAERAAAVSGKPVPGVYVLMGGSEDLKKPVWAEHPEADQILIGTQDMLLSRALMRGYGMSRYHWPVHYAWLHNGALWVFDEVQLMGPGLVTSAQLEAFRRVWGGTGSRSLWVSATFHRHWLKTVDFDAAALDAPGHSLSLSDAEKNSEPVKRRHESVKPLARCEVMLVKRKGAGGDTSEEDDGKGKPNAADVKTYLDALSQQVITAHASGATTLVILNTVDRAQGLMQRLDQHYQPVKKKGRGLAEASAPIDADGTAPSRLLVHSRFRAAERAELNRQLSEKADPDGPGRIIVATQAVEAGVDISARVMFTELAPWASMVQRFGRCNRYGEFNESGDACVYWIDVADAAPYEATEVDEARQHLQDLDSASPAALPPVTAPAPLHPVLRRKDFLDLFSTEADLSGSDVDIAPYIRDADDADILLFWRDVPAEARELDEDAPLPDELCRAGLGAAKNLLAKLGAGDVWQWDTRARKWERIASPKALRLRPGMTLMLRSACGGYSQRYGLDVDGLDADTRKNGTTPLARSADAAAGEALEDDRRSLLGRAVPLTTHLADVGAAAHELCAVLGLETTQGEGRAVVTSAEWHDIGKAHAAFVAMLRAAHKKGMEEELGPGFWAKSGRKRDADGKPRKVGRVEYRVAGESKPRKQFRHELASMLAWLEHHDGEPDADLIAYLIAAHHGKVRMSLRAWPGETEPDEPNRLFARGVWAGDVLPPVTLPDGHATPETTLRLDLMQLGEGVQGASWTTRTLRLLKVLGPFRLAYLEALVRVADWRASRREQEAGDHV